MAVAYLLEQNTSVNKEGERLVVKKEGKILHTLHIFKLDQVVVFGNVLLTPAAIAYLLRSCVDTVFLTRSGRYIGRLQPPYSKNITLRCEQFRRLHEERFCLETSMAIVSGKIANSRTILLRLNRNREGLGLEDRILGLKQMARKVDEAESMDALRGYEGRAAVLYFEGFAKGFLADGVTFKGRVRRPPTDPVNALLSLGYTLLFNTVMAVVSLVGFDPFLGCLHTVEYGRPSLALDLMEEWRQILVDSLVLSVFNLRTVTPADFLTGKADAEDLEENGVHEISIDEMSASGGEGSEGPPPPAAVKLTDSGFRKFITHFERKMNERIQYQPTGQQLAYRDCIREQARHFARVVRGEEKSYQPLVAR